MALTCGSTLATAETTAPQTALPSTPQQSSVQSDPRVDDLKGRIASVETKVADLTGVLAWGSGAVALITGVLGFFGYSTIRDWAKNYVERNLDTNVKEILADQLPKRLLVAQERVETQILRTATLLALRSQESYETVLSQYGWTGDVSSLRRETPLVRRVMVESLLGSKKDRPENRTGAWDAATELLRDDSSIETIRLYLRICISLRRYAEAVELFGKHKAEILKDKEAALRTSTILRKVGKLSDARDIAQRFVSDDDVDALLSYAVLERDLGLFDKVHDALLPLVHKLSRTHATQLPKGWHRVLNTFAANCLDRDHPEDAIEPAEFVLRSAPGPVELFTVGRLILALPAGDARRNTLIPRFQSGVETLVASQEMMEDATLRCLVTLKEIQGQAAEAISLLSRKVKETEDKSKPGEPLHPDVYFQRCSLAQLLIDNAQSSSAIDVLMPAIGSRHGGEAKYRIAIAYAVQNEGQDSARWLDQAISELPKWAVLARNNRVLQRQEAVAKLLANAQTRSKTT